MALPIRVEGAQPEDKRAGLFAAPKGGLTLDRRDGHVAVAD